jgi:hypothetical protein
MPKVLSEVEELQGICDDVLEILESALDPALECAEIVAKIDEAVERLTPEGEEEENDDSGE